MTVPNHWHRRTLGDVARWGSGGTPAAGNKAFYGGRIPWAVIGDLNEGVVNTTAKTITQEGLEASSAKWVPEGAVLVAMYGSIGKLGIAGLAVATNQAIAFAVPGPEVDGKFLFYYLMSQRRRLEEVGKGATQRNISQTLLRSWPIDLPQGLGEQRRIVEILEDHLSHLDAADRDLRVAEGRIDVLRLALLEVAIRPSEHWQALAVTDVTSGSRSDIAIGPFGSNLTTRDYCAAGVPLVFVRNVRTGNFDEGLKFVSRSKANELASHIAHDGDVVMTKMGDPPGDTSVYRGEPAVITADVLRVRPSSAHDADFVSMVLSGRACRQQVLSITSGVAQKKISLARFRSTVTLRLPERPLQVARRQAYRESCLALDRQLGVILEATSRSRSLRRRVLTAAFEGKLTGRDTDAEVIEEMADVQR